MPHDRTRQGTLSNAQTYEARYGEKRSVQEIAEAEGVTKGAIMARLAAERKRRQAAGKVVHRSKPGQRRLPRRRVLGKTVVVRPDPPREAPLPVVSAETSDLVATFTRALLELDEAIQRL